MLICIKLVIGFTSILFRMEYIQNEVEARQKKQNTMNIAK